MPFARKEDTGRGNVLRALLWDAHGATPTGPSSLQIFWMRDSCTLTNGVPDPTLSILITPAEPQVILDVEGRKQFLVDAGATHFVLNSPDGSLSNYDYNVTS